jgi:AraC family transcriptional regulator
MLHTDSGSTFHTDAVRRFSETCQIATAAFVKPTDSVRILTAVSQVLRGCPAPWPLEVAPRIAEILLSFARRTLNPSVWGPSGADASTRTSPQLRAAQALDALIAGPASCSMSLSTVAREIRVSRSHLCARVRLASGFGFHHHARVIRLLRAIQLIGDTDLSVAAVADQSGYRHPVALSRDFRQTLHVTPSRFRHVSRCVL